MTDKILKLFSVSVSPEDESVNLQFEMRTTKEHIEWIREKIGEYVSLKEIGCLK